MVVVDDGSIDKTFDAVRGLAALDRSIIPLRNERNKGKGAAVKSAASRVRGDVVILLDADMDILPETLREYVEVLKKYDICIASKRHPKSSYEAPVARKFLSVAFNKFVRLTTGVKFSDSQTGLKAMRAEAFKKIMALISVKRYAYDVEMLAVAELMGLSVAELPVQIQQKAAFSVRAVFYMVLDVLGIAYRLRVRKWYQQNLGKANVAYKPIIRI